MGNTIFYRIHYILVAEIREYFLPKAIRKKVHLSVQKLIHPKTTYLIKTTFKKSTIRYFARVSPIYIRILHGVSFTSMFKYVWGVVECVNNCNKLDLYFPIQKDQ